MGRFSAGMWQLALPDCPTIRFVAILWMQVIDYSGYAEECGCRGAGPGGEIIDRSGGALLSGPLASELRQLSLPRAVPGLERPGGFRGDRLPVFAGR